VFKAWSALVDSHRDVFVDVPARVAPGWYPDPWLMAPLRYYERPVVEILSTDDDLGYLMVADDSGLFAFGDAPFLGSLGGQGFSGIVGVVP